VTTQTPDRFPASRFEWERLVRRIVMAEREKLVCFILASYADADGTRVRPGELVVASVIGKSERTVRRVLSKLEDDLRLIELVSRGGGRGGTGRTNEYRLTIPVDLLDRVELLAPGDKPTTESPDNLVSGQSPQSPVDTPVDNTDRPDTHLSGQSCPQATDPADSPDSLVSGENDFHRTDNAVTDRLTGQNGSIDRTARVSDYQGPTTKRDQPPPALPAQPPDAHASEHHEKITAPPRQRTPHDRPAAALDALLAFTPSVRRAPPPSTPDCDP
jgi:hypothetical protein